MKALYVLFLVNFLLFSPLGKAEPTIVRCPSLDVINEADWFPSNSHKHYIAYPKGYPIFSIEGQYWFGETAGNEPPQLLSTTETTVNIYTYSNGAGDIICSYEDESTTLVILYGEYNADEYNCTALPTESNPPNIGCVPTSEK